MTSSNSISI